MKHDFNQLLQSAKAAFRAKDCHKARAVAGALRATAKTERQFETLFRLQNAVRRCGTKPLAGLALSCPRYEPSDTISVGKVPKGSQIIDCGDYYAARVGGKVARVDPGTAYTIEAKSRLRRAAIRGTFAGAKRRRSRK